jgi:glycine betaine/choline ABC-type transport system substrate-binding protein
MAPQDEKQKASWSNPDLGFNEEKSSFKKKRKYVYLEKYEETTDSLRKDIASLNKITTMLAWAIVVASIILGLIISYL